MEVLEYEDECFPFAAPGGDATDDLEDAPHSDVGRHGRYWPGGVRDLQEVEHDREGRFEIRVEVDDPFHDLAARGHLVEVGDSEVVALKGEDRQQREVAAVRNAGRPPDRDPPGGHSAGELGTQPALPHPGFPDNPHNLGLALFRQGQRLLEGRKLPLAPHQRGGTYGSAGRREPRPAERIDPQGLRGVPTRSRLNHPSTRRAECSVR